jgi:hypothetical protein
MYIPIHTNLGCFLSGLLAGSVYNKLQANNVDLRNSWLFKIMWHTVVPMGFAIVLAVHMFYENDFPKPSIWLSVYSSLNKNIWGALIIVFFIGFTQKLGCRFWNVGIWKYAL